MTQKNEYKWNECGVCTNPTTVKEWKKQNVSAYGYGVQINIAQLPNGKWCYGYEYNHGEGGGGSGVKKGFKGECFDTADEAERACIKRLLKYFQEYWATCKCLDIIGKLKEWLQPKQLSLFDL